jgi:hypothetical protein
VQLLLQNFTGEEKPFFVDLFATQLSRCMPAQVGALQQQTLNKQAKGLMKYAIVIEGSRNK